MSIDIWNGYQLPLMSAGELSELITRFTKLTAEKSARLVEAYMTKQMVAALDDLFVLDESIFVIRHVFYERETNKHLDQVKYEAWGAVIPEEHQIKGYLSDFKSRRPYTVYYYNTLERYQEVLKTDIRDPETDFDCSATFIPIHDKILVLFHSEYKEMHRHWSQMKEVSTYEYFDHSDKPKRISKSEWERRKQDWNEAVPSFRVERGITVNFQKGFPSRELLDPKRMVKLVPTLEERAKRVASSILMERKIEEFKRKLPEEKRGGVGAYFSARDWLSTEEGQVALAGEISFITPKLLPVITADHFITSYYDLKYGETEEGVKS